MQWDLGYPEGVRCCEGYGGPGRMRGVMWGNPAACGMLCRVRGAMRDVPCGTAGHGVPWGTPSDPGAARHGRAQRGAAPGGAL